MKIKLYMLSIILLISASQVSAGNPFAPPQKIQLFYQLVYQRTDNSLPQYKMFMTRDGKSYALLNDTFVSRGEEYEKMRVEKITKKAVVLQTAYGDKKIIVLQGLQSKLQEIQKMIEEGST